MIASGVALGPDLETLHQRMLMVAQSAGDGAFWRLDGHAHRPRGRAASLGAGAREA
jgi:hypothetical protein